MNNVNVNITQNNVSFYSLMYRIFKSFVLRQQVKF